MRGVVLITVLFACLVSVSALSNTTIPLSSLGSQIDIVVANATNVHGPFRTPVELGQSVISLIEIDGPGGVPRYLSYQQAPVRLLNESLTTSAATHGFGWNATYSFVSNATYPSIDVRVPVPEATNVSGPDLIGTNGTLATVRVSVPGTTSLHGVSEAYPGTGTRTITADGADIEANATFTPAMLDSGVSLGFASGPVRVTIDREAIVWLDSGGALSLVEPVNGTLAVPGNGSFSLDIYPEQGGTFGRRALSNLPIGPNQFITRPALINTSGPVTMPPGTDTVYIVNRVTKQTYAIPASQHPAITDQGPYDEDPQPGAVRAIVAFGPKPGTGARQGRAIVGQPVEWTAQAHGRVTIPTSAENLTIDGRAANGTVVINGHEINASSYEKLQELKAAEARFMLIQKQGRYLTDPAANREFRRVRSRITNLSREIPPLPTSGLDLPDRSYVFVPSANGTLAFRTPGPTMRTLSRGANGTLVAVNSSVHLKNVTVTVNIAPTPAADVRILWLTNGSRLVEPERLTDTNGDGLVDQVTFIAPHLSDQLFRIIRIATAEELDANRTALRNITSLVAYKDGVSALIPNGYYVRSRFTAPLDYRSEIIIVANGTGSIDVMPLGSNTTIATIRNIGAYGTYRTDLTGYTEGSDVFDLRVNGILSIDQIVDPITSAFYDPTNDTQIGWNCTGTNCTTGHYIVLDDGIREPAPVTNTTNYISAKANSNAVDGQSIDPITETNVTTITLWAYVTTGSNFQMTIDLLNNGTIVNSTTVAPSTTDAWEKVVWNTPTNIGNVSSQFTAGKSGGGSPSTGYVFAWYAQVTYNDTTPPQVRFVKPTTNTSTITKTFIEANTTASDPGGSYDTITTSLYNASNGHLVSSQSSKTSPFFTNFTGLAKGTYLLNSTANDTAGNTNATPTRTISIVSLRDLTIPTILVGTPPYRQGQSVTFHVNVTNIGGTSASGFNVSLNISLWNGTWLAPNETIKGPYSLGPGASMLVNYTWKAALGEYNLTAYADPEHVVAEGNESNNEYTKNVSTSSWNVVFGTFDSFNISLLATDLFRNWVPTNYSGVIFYADADSSYLPSNLKPLNGTNDLAEADKALNMTYYNDSISRRYDKNHDGVPDHTATFDIAGKLVRNVPIINSTNTSAFVTGIMWDSADGGTQYNGSQDLVFVTKINQSHRGEYGTYDYEVTLPSPLRRLKPGTDLITRTVELS